MKYLLVEYGTWIQAFIKRRARGTSRHIIDDSDLGGLIVLPHNRVMGQIMKFLCINFLWIHNLDNAPLQLLLNYPILLLKNSRSLTELPV